jgi:hypothetical protein
MKLKPIQKFSTIGELLEMLRAATKGRSNIWFRGHADSSWSLTPSIMRPPQSFTNEVVLLKKFKQNAVPLLEHVPRDEADWLFLMQHHGVPTRLLDWTESPLVALYFAVAASDPKHHTGDDAALWCLFPQALNDLSKIRMNPEHDIPSFGHEPELDDYLPSRAIGITTADKLPVALIAPRPFRRLHVQQGVFTLFHRNTSPIENLTDKHGKKPHFLKFVIPKKARNRLREELALLQIDRLALFPELENVATRISPIQS